MKVILNTFNFKNPYNIKTQTCSADSKPKHSNNNTIRNVQNTSGKLRIPQNINFQANFMPLGFTSKKGRITKEDFPLAQFGEKLRCPCCGDRMKFFNETEAKKLAQSIASKKGRELNTVLLENLNEIQTAKRTLAREIAEAALQYPDKDISELLNTISEPYMDKLRTKQINVAAELVNQLSNLKTKDKIAIKKWRQTQVHRIMHAKEEGDFRNKYLIASFIRFTKKKYIKINKEKVYEYFEKLPNSKRDTEAFVAKYKRRNADETAYRLLKNASPTIEHIVPFHTTGDNSFSNLMMMCSDCNNNRGSLSYDDFLKMRPQMRDNLDSYFEDIIKLLRSPSTPLEVKQALQDYTKNTKKTLRKYTNGKLYSRNEQTSSKAG